MTPAPEECAWLAGIYEGEGTVHGKKGYQLKIGMTDLDIIERLQAITGLGQIYLCDQGPPRKLRFDWSLTNKHDVMRFLNWIEPWLGCRRREQVFRAFAPRDRGSLPMEWFGKKRKDLAPGELREYNRRRESERRLKAV